MKRVRPAFVAPDLVLAAAASLAADYPVPQHELALLQSAPRRGQ